MALHHSPRIVTSGLVIALDSADVNSYVSGSSSWLDLSGNRSASTLNNGPAYDNSNGGSIVFDGSNDHVLLPTLPSLTSFTIEIWFKCAGAGSVGETSYGTLIGNSGANRLLYNYTPYLLAQLGAGNHFSTIAAPLNTWCCVHYVYNSSNTTAQWFINSTADSTRVGSITLNTTQRLGAYDLANYMLKGNISIAKIYNRNLSAIEILQNYSALKGRYGLK